MTGSETDIIWGNDGGMLEHWSINHLNAHKAMIPYQNTTYEIFLFTPSEIEKSGLIY